MRVEWGKNYDELTLIASDNYDRLFLSIIEKQVCDRGVYIVAVESRLKDTQQKMHAKCTEVKELKDQLYSKSLIGTIQRLLGI